MPSVRQFLQDNGGRFCLSVPGRDHAVTGLAEAVTLRFAPAAKDWDGSILDKETEIAQMLADGTLRLEEEHTSGGAFWAFTLTK